MNLRHANRFFAALLASLFALALPIQLRAATIVKVSVRTDATNLRVGQTTKAHVFARIDTNQLANTVQIFAWYVDLLNSSSNILQIDATTVLTPFSDSDPTTSSNGVFDGTNIHGIYNTMLNTPGAGHDSEIELFNVVVKANAIGTASLSVAAGTGAPALDHDFIVATTGSDPLYGGDYSQAAASISSFLNTPPTLDPISDATIDEGSLFTFTALGHDVDAGQTLSYTLLGTVPAGASIAAATGVFTWTPAENQGPGTYHFSVQVADNGTPTMTATNDFNITVREVNRAPTVTVPTDQTRPEMVAISLSCAASDPDLLAGQTTNRLTFSLVNAPAGAAINSASGLFTWTPTEDQGPADYTIQVVVTDNGSPALSGTNSFVIHVTEVNRGPSLAAPADRTIAELSVVSFSFTGSDPDLPANNLTYSLLNAPAGVIIEQNTGIIDWTPTEAQGPGNYTIKVVVSDNQNPPLFATNSVNVTVTEVNDPPSLTSISDRTISELTPLNVTATATDSDLPAQTLTFSLDTAPAGVQINTNTGAITWTPTEAQGPGRYTIAVRVTDNGSPARSDIKSFDVVVNEVNSPPTLSAPSSQTNQTVVELSTVTVNFSAADSDIPANLITFSILDGPLGATINPVNGVLTWTPTEAQGPGTYSIKVVATDNGVPPLSATNTIQISVTETNSPPSINPIADRTIAELSKLTVNITATDPDIPVQTLAFSLDSAPTGAAIDAATGVFTWTPTEDQGPGSYDIVVRVRETSGGNLFGTNGFKVTVTEVNSAPVVQVPAALTRPEMSPITVNITATDSDILRGSTPSSNHIAFSLLNPPAGASIDAATGVFSWTPTEAQGPATYQIKIVATDDGVPPLSGTNTLTINVTEVNQPPTITAPADQTIVELTPLSVSFQASDPDLPANTLTFSLLSAPAGVLLNPNTGAITWTPTEAQGPGTYSIKVAVSDNAATPLRATNSFNVTVLETNSPPVLTGILDQNIRPLVPFTITAQGSDSDIPAQTLVYSLDVAPAGASINSSNGVLTWTPSAAQGPGNYVVTVRVSESGAQGLFDTKSFRITVSAPNNPPSILSPPDQTVIAGSTITVTNVAADLDTTNTLTFAIVSAPSGAALSASSGVLAWTPSLAQVGTNTLQVKVTDNGIPALSATNNFKIIVRAPNTAPVLLTPADRQVVAGTAVTVTNVATDADVPTNTLSFAIVSGPSGAILDAATGILIWVPSLAQLGTNTFQVKVTDNGSPALSASNSFKVIVTAPNTAPILLSPGDQSAIAGSAINVTNMATDADVPTNTLSFAIVSAPAGATINASSGVLTWTPSLAQVGTTTVQVKVTDNGTPVLSATNSFKIVVRAPNTAPVIQTPPNQDVLAGTVVFVTNVATDADVPTNTLTFSIVSGPAGAIIDASSGVLIWVTSTNQIGTNNFQVRVTDNGTPVLSATNSFKVIVHGPNTAPTLQTPAGQEVFADSTITVTNVATDADIPADTLTFAIVSAPSGATINASSGVVTWTPTTAQLGTNTFQVKVTDNGLPPLSATNTFQIVVKSATPTQPTLKAISVGAGGFTLQLNGQASTVYTLEFSTNLTAWSTLTTISLGVGETNKTYLDTAHGAGQKLGFYRVKVGAPTLPSAPTLRALSASSLGFNIRVAGDANTSYRLEWTTDFTTWNNLTTVTLPVGGSLDYLDATHTLTTQRIFYRAIAP